MKRCTICGLELEKESDIDTCSSCCNHPCARNRKKDKMKRETAGNTTLTTTNTPDQRQSSISKPIQSSSPQPAIIEIKAVSELMSLSLPLRYQNCDAILINSISNFWSFWNSHKPELTPYFYIKKDEKVRWWLCKKNGANPSPVVKLKTLF